MSKDNKVEILLEKVIADFINEQQKITKSTIKSLNSEAHIFLKYCYSKIKNKPIILSETIFPDFLIDYLNQFNNPQTIAKKMSFFKYFIDYLYSQNYIESNFDAVHLFTKSKISKQTPKFFTNEQLRELVQLAKEGPNGIRNYCIILILVAAGLRVDELRHLKISDIDFENESLLIKWKSRTIRKIRVSSFIIETVRDYINAFFKLGRNNSNKDEFKDCYIFPSRDQKIPLSSRMINY